MSIMQKVRRPRLRPPAATPKEQQAWESFLALASELKGGADGQTSPLVLAELERLCAKGNPIAIRFKERLAIASFKPRQATEAPVAPPAARRIRSLKWLHSSEKGPSKDE